MKIRFIYIALVLITFSQFFAKAKAQQIDTDSLLFAALEMAKEDKEKTKAISMARLGANLAPNYLDFHLLLGRLYKETGGIDSARYYLHYVIDANPDYKDAFSHLLRLEYDERNAYSGLKVSEQAIEKYPEEVSFYTFKHGFIQLKRDEREEFDFLKKAISLFPEQSSFRQRLNLLELRLENDRIGTNYSLTVFDRDGVGPWHLTGLQYIRERRWGSLIGRVNYANRLSSGSTIDSGFQYELESYFFTGRRSYSYVGLAYSPSTVFPEQRYGYSFFQNLDKGWEWEIGGRYTSVVPPEGRRDFRSLIFGLGKYVGSWWINLRSFVQNEDNQYYPAFTLTTRYYLNTRFDYFTLITGYGTSPDERQTLGQFENRVALDSWRGGVGYFRLIGKKFVTGTQLMYNYQEYHPGRTQQELEFSILLQYKF
ncbi:YaiO family outer membrane beta-barrel protein [Cecembia rubra]|uniref:YaiO family outer membrane protein n=1 Tax=Cecembia rubra TaxID=1485585 RepID=A0A2P8EEK6_9BACT|nr:YaiO family outer membrane beta-barrel protein [Cecembia rubra]PSL07897.1 YaiO family outer membrane protein [Cecembia rubra]